MPTLPDAFPSDIPKDVWYCCECSEGPNATSDHCPVCGHPRDGMCTYSGLDGLANLEGTMNVGGGEEKVRFGNQVWSDEDLEGCGSQYEILSHINQDPYAESPIRTTLGTGVSYIAGVGAALEAGDYPRPWSLVCNFCSDSFTGEYRKGSLSRHITTASIVFAAAATTVYQIHRRDRFQDRFLFAGITLGIATGLAMRRDLYDTVLEILPGLVLLSLLFSIVFHRIVKQKCSDCGHASCACCTAEEN